MDFDADTHAYSDCHEDGDAHFILHAYGHCFSDAIGDGNRVVLAHAFRYGDFARVSGANDICNTDVLADSNTHKPRHRDCYRHP